MDSSSTDAPKRKRTTSRPTAEGYASVRDVLLRCGMELLTEQGFAATGLGAVLKRATVPKGSFYYYFGTKEAFGLEVLQAYDTYFSKKLDRWLTDESRAPLDRLLDFVSDASRGMAKHDFKRGCLVGNLSQELGALPEPYRAKLDAIFNGWQAKVACCLKAAQQQGQIHADIDCADLAMFFWMAWEGAVLRARLVKSSKPLDTFIRAFLASPSGLA